MKAVYDIFVKSLAIIGLVYLGFTLSAALEKHYRTTCVDNDADNYGFTVPQIKAGHETHPALYERYL